MIRGLPDLVRDSKLVASFVPGATLHLYSLPGGPDGEHFVQVQETWQRGRELATGASGRVWLEHCVNGPQEGLTRTIREVKKDPAAGGVTASAVYYSRELEAMAQCSGQRVRRDAHWLQPSLPPISLPGHIADTATLGCSLSC